MNKFIPLPDIVLQPMVKSALLEDLGDRGDITSAALIDIETTAKLDIVVRFSGVICGLQLVYLAFKLIDSNTKINFFVKDGNKVDAQTIIAKVEGKARSLLTAERVALNFLTSLSGIASQTRNIVDIVSDFPVKITCTRKTIPNFRAVQKYAVRCGGAINHRMNLSDAILIKDNHIAIVGSISQSIKRAKMFTGHCVPIEIEVDNLEQLSEALIEGIDLVLLDNMDLTMLEKAVSMCNGKAKTEASGGMNLQNVKEVAQTGVDFISVGALTHSFSSLDIGLDYIL